MTSTTPRFTESLRSAAGAQWGRVVNHKFTNELASGEIDRKVLTRYLIQDHRFLDAFTSLLGALICKARCLEDRIPACQFAALITSDENTYFLRCFEKLGCADAKEREAVPSAPCTVGFIELMHEVANTGTLGEILSVLVVCEWSYMTWGERVAPMANRDHFECYEWVDLHSGDGFTGVVNYLRGLLDKEGDLIDEEGRAKCKSRFLQAVQLEEDFFDNAYIEISTLNRCF